MKTPYGVLVASQKLISEVLLAAPDILTATQYLPRMRNSFGELYLGLDDTPSTAYQSESAIPNQAVLNLGNYPKATIEQAATVASKKLNEIVEDAKLYATQDEEIEWDLTLDVREVIDEVIAKFCETWFGLSENTGSFKKGGYHWNWQAGQLPLYPGHFMAPSRYVFQPHPDPEVQKRAHAHGNALSGAMQSHLNTLLFY